MTDPSQVDNDDLPALEAWRLKPGQFVTIVALAIVVVAQLAWAGISIATNGADSRQVLNQEADVSALTFTQRESFTVLQRIDRWVLDDVTTRDVLISRANLSRRLSVVTDSGLTTFELTQPQYREALTDLDDVLRQLEAVDDGERAAFREQHLDVLATFDQETRELSTEFQRVLNQNAMQSISERFRAEFIYLGMVILSVGFFLAVMLWVGSDMLRTHRALNTRLEHEKELLRRSRERLLLLSVLEKESTRISKLITEGEGGASIRQELEDLLIAMLPEDTFSLEETPEGYSVTISETDPRVSNPDRAVIAARARELLDQLHTRDQSEESLQYQATHDVLTGLLNRHSFTDQLRRRVDTAAGGGSPVLVVAFDIERFGEFNAALGFEAGDQLLIEVANRLSEAFSDDSLIARVAADEFAIVFDMPNKQEAESRAKAVHDLVQFTAHVADTASPITTSSAAVWVEGPEAHSRDVVGQLGLLLRMAKDTDGDRFIFFDPSVHEGVDSHWVEDLELHRALREGEFVLHFQPIVELATGGIVGCESLVRWEKPGAGLVPPGDFLPGIERAGLTVDLGREIIEHALLTWKKTLHKAPDNTLCYVGINADPRQLLDPSFADYVLSLAQRIGVPPEAIVIEVTERDLTEGPEANAQLTKLREGGVRIAVDDFGTGYSNLSQLHSLPVDIIKIDRSFLQSINDSYQSLGLISDIVQLAKRLGLSVIAEGIEEESIKNRLADIGVPYGQGFLFTPALTAEDLLEWASVHQEATL